MGRFGGYGYHMPFTGIFAWHGYIGLAIQILIFIALVIGVIYLIKALTKKKDFSLNNNFNLNNPIAIAKMRLAKGEISKEEYENILKTLQK